MTGRVFFPSMPRYRKSYLRPDLIAGLTVWAVLVPEALAYASIAGVPAVVGLYAAVPALVLYAVFGSSRHLVVGPMSATAALSAAIVGPMVAGDPVRFAAMSAALAVVTGIVGVLAGLFRAGFIAAFISEPVLKGFIIGLALTIIIGQVPKLLGVDKGSGNFFGQLWAVLTRLGDVDWRTALIGILSLAGVLAFKRWLPLLPGSLVAVVAGIVAVHLLHLDAHGVAVVGHIDAGLPDVGLPTDIGLSDYLALVGPALGVLLIGFAEGLGAAKTYAAKSGYTIDANRELLGMGAANAGAGLCSGMVVNGSLSKTAVNGGAGARSQVSGLTVAVLTVVTLLFLTGLFEKLPEATLAAVVIAAVVELVDFAALRRLYAVWTSQLAGIYGHATRVDFISAVAAMIGVLVFDTLPGLFIGITVSLLVLLYRVSRPHVARLGKDGDRWVDLTNHPDAQSPPGTSVVRVEAGIFFANADNVRDAVLAQVDPDTTTIVIDAETSPSVDVTAVEMLVHLAEELRARGVALRIARDVAQFREALEAVDRSGSLPVYDTVHAALEAGTKPDD
ncbi:SulP family inorganic anion transporter [Gordonia alkaliphila]|uniref:SulP family inorganic anion transporter n=1 Tax=Gordonia alkaliphila TaxID=1053547 RepID=A0ABP8Z027_9ACTN